MITVSLRPKLSPIYPNIIAPNGRSIKTEEVISSKFLFFTIFFYYLARLGTG